MNNKVDHVQQLFGLISEYPDGVKLHPNFLFRGQAKTEWSLQPSFTRLANKLGLRRKKALQLERESINRFSISGSALLPLEKTMDLSFARFKSSDGRGMDFIGWLSLMQHFSAPTRNLDWSISPWVALYFACFEEENCDGALWIADFLKVDEYNKKHYPKLYENFTALITDPDAEAIIAFSMAFNSNERIEAQQGRFSVCTNPLVDHKVTLEQCEALSKIEVPKELKRATMIELQRMNITAKSLFPGIDGLGRSITEYCSLWDEGSTIS